MGALVVWNCSQLVTLAGPARPRCGAEMRELAAIRDGAMLVCDGRIERVGTLRGDRAGRGRLLRGGGRGRAHCHARLRRCAHPSGLRGHARR